ncbi:MAG: undecaprenyldiphospho-muramoylpentapeptide beta-N-acetylglucosaminyltransferase [Bacteroidota bacterium]
MSVMTGPYRLIISGGGTGGHIFPALAVADEFRVRYPESEILFVGAKGRMEMTRVPAAGFRIIGLWISGLQRSLTLSNLLFPVKLVSGIIRAFGIIRTFKPHAVIGTGGYASGPVMIAATRSGVPTLIQEQNSYAGLTNRKLAAKADVICVAYDGMDRYFPSTKIRFTGNPVRAGIGAGMDRGAALESFGLSAAHKTILVLGGSLGAATINSSLTAGLDAFAEAGIQVIWQCGKRYHEALSNSLEGKSMPGILLLPFISSMDAAYAAADLVISRSGALSISELCLAGKPVILVPSPNVAEDHQTKNAMALVSKSAAVLVKDADAEGTLVATAIGLIKDEGRCAALSAGIRALAKPQATREIVDEIEKLINSKKS